LRAGPLGLLARAAAIKNATGMVTRDWHHQTGERVIGNQRESAPCPSRFPTHIRCRSSDNRGSNADHNQRQVSLQAGFEPPVVHCNPLYTGFAFWCVPVFRGYPALGRLFHSRRDGAREPGCSDRSSRSRADRVQLQLNADKYVVQQPLAVVFFRAQRHCGRCCDGVLGIVSMQPWACVDSSTFAVSWPSRPGHLLRLNPRARLSPAFCFPGTPIRSEIQERMVPARKHSGRDWERGRSLSGCPRNEGRQKRRI
jgi:hypothetical protein